MSSSAVAQPSTVRALGMLFGLHLAARLTDLLLADRAALATAAGGLLVLWGAEKAGVELSPTAEPRLSDWGRELGLGAGVALVGFVGLVAAGLALRGSVALGGAGGSLVLALVRAGFRGVRDELVLTGAAVLVAAHLGRPGLAPTAAALTHLADSAGGEGATASGVSLAAAGGALAGALWSRGSGARAATWSASWGFLGGLGLRGALVDLRDLQFVLQPTHRASGALAWIAVALLAALALVAWRAPWRGRGTRDGAGRAAGR